MKPLRGVLIGGLLAGAAMAMSACTTTGPGGGQSAAARPANPAEGEWVTADGDAVSRLVGGSFTTTATDTGATLAQGSYRIGPDKTISLQGKSLIRQTDVAFNCLQANQDQLNCTNANGQNFTLRRRNAAPV